MSSHFKLYDGMGEVVPFNARYQYPTQANRTWKSNIKIPPKNGGQPFRSGYNSAPIRIEFPAQGYLDARNSFLSFDVAFLVDAADKNVRIQNNVQSLFRRLRLMYGSLVIEDMPAYNILVRMLTEGAGTNTQGLVDQTAINEGVAGYHFATSPLPGSTDTTLTADALNDTGISTATAPTLQTLPVNGRLWNIQSGNADLVARNSLNSEPNLPRWRRYQVQIALGFFQQGKLIPLKWMASQLTLEIELASFEEACAYENINAAITHAQPSFLVDNITFNAQLLEFDGSYDAAFLEGLRGEGVPIKFASWDHFIHTPSASTSQTFMIPERNRSLKAIFGVLTPPAASNVRPAAQASSLCLPVDSHAFLNSASLVDIRPPNQSTVDGGGAYHGYCKGYQFRIGGKYYPAQPVDCGQQNANGAAEAYMEFAKALNIVGDYRLSTGITPGRWCKVNRTGSANDVISNILDYPGAELSKLPQAVAEYGDGPSCFVIAADLETSNGGEISGMNGEEQNDISLNVTYSAPQDPTCTFHVFVYYDVLMVLRENNLVEIIK